MSIYWEIMDLIEEEKQRQENEICLIASENYMSKGVIDACGSVLINKYAEGYPEHRYYAGCEVVDKIEKLANERARKLFDCKWSNVQPNSGSQANQAVYLALCKPGDTILGMGLDAGGHLTHGSKVSSSGKLYNAISYGLDENGFLNYDEIKEKLYEYHPKLLIVGASAYPRIIDFERIRNIVDEYNQEIILSNDEELGKKIDKAVFPGIQGGPLVNMIAGKAIGFGEALEPSFKAYQEQVLKNIQAMVEVFKENNVKMITGGSDNHLILLDLKDECFSGKDLETVLEKQGIITNKNAVQNDPKPKTETSGLRIGCAAITSRGATEDDAHEIALLICANIDYMRNHNGRIPDAMYEFGKKWVNEWCKNHPIYKD